MVPKKETNRIMDELWETINLRNEVQSFQDGLFVASIPTFSEGAVREALLNAQFDLKENGRFPVLILIAGVESSGLRQPR